MIGVCRVCIAVPGVSNGEHVDRPCTSLIEDSRVRHQDLLPDVKHVKARSHRLYPRLVRTSVDLRLAMDAGAAETEYRRIFGMVTERYLFCQARVETVSSCTLPWRQTKI